MSEARAAEGRFIFSRGGGLVLYTADDAPIFSRGGGVMELFSLQIGSRSRNCAKGGGAEGPELAPAIGFVG